MPENDHVSSNELLQRAGPRALRGLRPLLEPVTFDVGTILYRPGESIDECYFPVSGFLSGLVVMDDGATIEVTMVGREGMWYAGTLHGIRRLPYRVIVQTQLAAYRVAAADLQAEVAAGRTLQDVFRCYHEYLNTFQSQSGACNGLHSVRRRCCRWLLMARDSLGTDHLPLTHEFLAFMLGVRRASVSEVLQPLHKRGLIRAGRGEITILDRAGLEAASCECYRTIRDAYKQSFASLAR